MALIELNKNPGNRDLMIFGSLWFSFAAFFATLMWWDEQRFAALFLGLVAIGIPVTGFLYRPFIRMVYLGTAYVTYPIGWVLSHIILLVIYYTVFTVMALLMKLFRIDPMNRKWQADSDTYWTEHRHPNKLKRYFHQY